MSRRSKKAGAALGAPNHVLNQTQGRTSRPPRVAAYLNSGAKYLDGWTPSLRDPRSNIIAAYSQATAKAVDAMANSGWLSGAIDAQIAAIIGPGLRLNAKPDYRTIGWSQDQADAWSADVENKFETWANDPVQCDLGGRMTLAQYERAALLQYFGTGEIVTLHPYRKRYGSPIGTKFSLIPSFRLDAQSYSFENYVQGVKLDSDGLPIGYRFVLQKPDNALAIDQYVTFPARDEMGRPFVTHVFDVQAGAVRGISPLTPALKVVRQFDLLADATLTATILQTIFAATIESQEPTEQILEALQQSSEGGEIASGIDAFFTARAGWYDGTSIDLGNNGKIAHLFPGEKLQFNKAQNPTSDYDSFAKFLLREIARCIGCSFEQLTGDYTGATYSSVRMAASDFWPLVLTRRNNLVARSVQAIYDSWLEEMIDVGLIDVPGGISSFLANRNAFTRADWRGPPKPQADDNKLASAHQTWRDMGVMTDEQICADLGSDYEDTYEQRAQEKRLREKLGIEPEPPVQPNMASPNNGQDQPNVDNNPING